MGVALGTEGTHPRRAPCGGWPRGQRPRSEAGPRVSGGFSRAAAPSTTSCLARCQGPQEGARRPRAPLAPQCCSEALRGGPQSDLPGEKGLGLRADPTPAVHTGRGWCPGLRGLGRDGVVARSPPIEKTPLQADVRSPPPPHRQLPLGRVKPQQLAGEVRGHLVQGSGLPAGCRALCPRAGRGLGGGRLHTRTPAEPKAARLWPPGALRPGPSPQLVGSRGHKPRARARSWCRWGRRVAVERAGCWRGGFQWS